MFVFTEEQIRAFTLEQTSVRTLKFNCKLAAKDGIRIRRACITRAANELDFEYITILGNRGEIMAMSTSDARLNIKETFANVRL